MKKEIEENDNNDENKDNNGEKNIIKEIKNGKNI